MTFSKHKAKALFLTPLILLWGCIICFITFSVPYQGINQFQDISYSDTSLAGNSITSVYQKQDALFFSYELKEGYQWPYVGICLSPISKKNLVGHDKILLNVHTKKTKVVPILINEYLPNYSDSIHNTGYREWEYKLKLEEGKTSYEIPFSDFEVPLNWYENNNTIHKKDYPSFKSERIKGICISNCPLIGVGNPETIKISNVGFKKDYSKWIMVAGIFSGIWVIISVIIFLIKKTKISVYIPYVTTETHNNAENSWEDINQYIANNYMHDLDMDTLEKTLGIARHKISALIKTHTNLIFKQYLNQVRIAEAKRLLKESDLPISEIADQVGFGHISNFNRVFKDHTGSAPSDVRKSNRTI